jgi:hypothetical protein
MIQLGRANYLGGGGAELDEAFATELGLIPWFTAVGQPLPAGLPFDPLPVRVWAQDVGGSQPWDEVLLEASNRLTRFLSDRYRARYRQWNMVTFAVRDRVDSLRDTIWQPFAARRGLGPPFADWVAWDVVHAAMEHEYRDCAGRPIFSLDLLRVYRAGHVPCGWQGKWPNGRLVVW